MRLRIRVGEKTTYLGVSVTESSSFWSSALDTSSIGLVSVQIDNFQKVPSSLTDVSKYTAALFICNFLFKNHWYKGLSENYWPIISTTSGGSSSSSKSSNVRCFNFWTLESITESMSWDWDFNSWHSLFQKTKTNQFQDCYRPQKILLAVNRTWVSVIEYWVYSRMLLYLHHRNSKLYFHPAKFDKFKDEKISVYGPCGVVPYTCF